MLFTFIVVVARIVKLSSDNFTTKSEYPGCEVDNFSAFFLNNEEASVGDFL